MPHSLILPDHRFVGLAVFVGARCVSSRVKEEFSLVEIFPVACYDRQFGQRHLCNLVARNSHELIIAIAYFTAHTIGISYRDVEKIPFASGLVMGCGGLNHVA